MTALVLHEKGPRIVSLQVEGHGELLAGTDVALDGPLGKVPLIGGHRLWSAPEVRAITYVPDTKVRIVTTADGIRVVSDDPRLTFEKTMHVRAIGESLVIDHVLSNRSADSIEAAGWAITMIRAGGTVVMPAPRTGLDEDGLQARFALVTWPYTDLADKRLEVANDGVRVHIAGVPTLKVGVPNLRGWVVYVIDGLAFVKWTRRHDLRSRYADFGASIQTFVGHGFGEIETLGPLTFLEPGASLTHREVWHVYDLEADLPDLAALDLFKLPANHPLLDLNP